MNAHTLRVLEYDAVRARVVEQTSNSLGRERAEAMEPSTDEDEVGLWLAQTAEGARLFDLSGGIPLGGIHDIRPAIRAGVVGGALEPPALLHVADTAAASRKLRAYLLQRHESVPNLAAFSHRLIEFPHLERAIQDAISEQAEVRDDASPALERLRKEIRTLRGRMMARLNSILRGSGCRDMIQDPLVTTRDGRFCIPVKSEYRSQFGGLVHDQSSSGATVFMEPASVVELGNELRQVEVRERQEAERILRELTALVGKHAEDLSYTVDALGELDFIFARARLATAMNAAPPQVNKEGFVGLRRARHPLLSGDVAPVDVELGRSHTVIVITGPNTGGKTVSLKTVGLLVLMAQSGLHLPADEGSTVPVFRGVYADIGDEQSIQQSLSTFSAHVRNISQILKEAEITKARSLVLLDEVGAGTDPAEGAALAKAILQRLLELGARTIATTHYGELKEFAYSTPGVENAGVEFDVQTLRPTYRLLIGIPGTSHAFSIASRLGLPEPIVQGARGMIGTDRAVLSDVIQRLTEEQRMTEVDLRKAADAAREIETMREQLRRDLRQAKADRIDTLNRARAEAEGIVRNARKEMDRVREELKQLEKEARRLAEQPGSTQALQQLRDRLGKLSGRVEERADKVAQPAVKRPAPAPAEAGVQTDRTPPAVGDLVWVSGFNQRGTLLSPPMEGKARVQIGSIHTTVPFDSLKRIITPRHGAPGPAPAGAAAAGAAGRAADLRMQARANVSPEVDLRGMRADEALTRLEGYVDDACLAGLSPFRVVHGKGTYALKKIAWEYLRDQPNVARFYHPGDEEGGNGVTIVELRE